MLRLCLVLCGMTAIACGARTQPVVLVAGQGHANAAAPIPTSTPAPAPATTATTTTTITTIANRFVGLGVRPRRVITSTSITLLDSIQFIGTTAFIDPASRPTLDAIASSLQGNPAIRVMEVQAYGGPSIGLEISGQQRAHSVMRYLIHKGVRSTRLRASGNGPVLAGSDGRPKFLIVQRD